MEKSRQLAYINNTYGFTISIINADMLIDEISKIHNIGPLALDFYKKTILGSTQLINYLKANESLGFYIDSEEPYFRYKIELSNSGSLRTLLLPEEFDSPPSIFTGRARIHKIMLGKNPYTSILEYKDFQVEEIINDVLEHSYQTNAKIIYSKNFTSSLLITKLPPTNINKRIEDFEEISLEKFITDKSEFLTCLLESSSKSIENFNKLCKAYEFSYLGSHEIKFSCPCSHERMVDNFITLNPSDIEEIFKDSEKIDVRCDYCNTIYEIHSNEIKRNTIQ